MVDQGRGEAGQRWASIAVGAAVILLVGWMTCEAAGVAPRAHPREGDAGLEAASSTQAQPAGSSSATAEARAATVEDLDAGQLVPSLALPDAAVLPSGAPRQIRIGVVLVSFQGAEGAPPNARSRRDALAVAGRLEQEARADFHRAVTSGDSGSSDDIGRLPRGVLDPRTEVAVFALAPGEISSVLETPRGYWIVKRIE